MKRMHFNLVAFIAGLVGCGLLVLRHAVRTAVTVPPVSDLPVSTQQIRSPVDRWQDGIKADTRTDHTPDPAATKRFMEKLRQEELRQRPQEGRN